MSEKEEKISEEWYVKLFYFHSDFQEQIQYNWLLLLDFFKFHV